MAAEERWIGVDAVETRYPGDWMDITESEMQEALQTAEHTILWAKSILASGADET